MKNDFIITIKYKGKTLTYMSKKDDLLLEKDNNNNIELMKNRTIKILEKDLWNSKNFNDNNIK
jgi:hypothetical protein